MKISFENSLYIKSIDLVESTLNLTVYFQAEKCDPEEDFEQNYGSHIRIESNTFSKSLPISEATFVFENIEEIWWDDWWEEDKDRVDLTSIDLDNIHWRFDEADTLQYNAPKYDVNPYNLNDLNFEEWDTTLWSSFIELETDDFITSAYHLVLAIPHDLKTNKNQSGFYNPVHIKGRKMRIITDNILD